jgi:hypothetical protein
VELLFLDYVWCSIAYEIFRRDEWEETDIDLVEADLERPSETINGYSWESTTTSYDISPEIFYLHEKARLEVFAKLEPESDRENKIHPEWYGKWCVYCKIWTREYPEEICPKCGKELLPLPLNED